MCNRPRTIYHKKWNDFACFLRDWNTEKPIVFNILATACYWAHVLQWALLRYIKVWISVCFRDWIFAKTWNQYHGLSFNTYVLVHLVLPHAFRLFINFLVLFIFHLIHSVFWIKLLNALCTFAHKQNNVFLPLKTKKKRGKAYLVMLFETLVDKQKSLAICRIGFRKVSAANIHISNKTFKIQMPLVQL